MARGDGRNSNDQYIDLVVVFICTVWTLYYMKSVLFRCVIKTGT